jgi:hypothetical protein
MSLPRLLRHGALVIAVTASVLVTGAPVAQARPAHCGMRIKHDFTLRRDLRNCRGDGLVVVADNVTVNLRGHLVDGRRNRHSFGVRVAGAQHVVIRRGRIRQFGMGILLVDSPHVRILRNKIRGSFDEGVFTDETSDHVLIAHNRIVGSGMRSREPWADAVDERGDAVRVIANLVLRNHDDGIDMNGTDLTVARNRVVGNVHDGIDVDGHHALVEDNVSVRNGDDGIGVSRNATSVMIRHNITRRNADLGIQPVADTFEDGGGNRASRNGDARQCVRVVCAP